MQEYVSEAIILNKEPMRSQDGRYSLFTARFGKVIGRAISSRKITSKLAPHLEPGMLTKVRFIEKNGTNIVDALKISRLSHGPTDLRFLSALLPEGQREDELWELLAQEPFSWQKTLRILGWDPEGAQCVHCGKMPVSHFYIPRQEFFCKTCASKLRKDALILLVTTPHEPLQPEFSMGEQREKI